MGYFSTESLAKSQGRRANWVGPVTLRRKVFICMFMRSSG